MTLCRERLPLPADFYGPYIKRGRRPNAKGWVAARCPFHDSRSGASLSVNLRNGGWVCWAGCGKGDIIKFVMKLHGVSFKDACRTLGAWEEPDGKRRKPKRQRTRLVRYLTMDFVIDGVKYSATVPDEPKPGAHDE